MPIATRDHDDRATPGIAKRQRRDPNQMPGDIPVWRVKGRNVVYREGTKIVVLSNAHKGRVFGLKFEPISMNTEKTLEECKRHIDECAALLERTSVPEYREAILAMGKAWMKIAEQAKIKASR